MINIDDYRTRRVVRLQQPVFDVRSLAGHQRYRGIRVIFDATHSGEIARRQGTSSAAREMMVKYLARAAVAAGVDGIFRKCTRP